MTTDDKSAYIRFTTPSDMTQEINEITLDYNIIKFIDTVGSGDVDYNGGGGAIIDTGTASFGGGTLISISDSGWTDLDTYDYDGATQPNEPVSWTLCTIHWEIDNPEVFNNFNTANNDILFALASKDEADNYTHYGSGSVVFYEYENYSLVTHFDFESSGFDWRSGLIGYWDFDGMGGNTNVPDMSGYNIPGTETSAHPYLVEGNDPGYAQGVYGLCAYYNGTDEYHSTTNVSDFDVSVGSVSFWFNLDARGGSGHQPFGLYNSINNTDTWFATNINHSDGFFAVVLKEDGNIQWRLDTDDDWIDDYIGEWVHFVVTQDGVSPHVYVNGEDIMSDLTWHTSTDTSKWFSDLFLATDPVDSMYVGCRMNDTITDLFFDGKLDELMIYDRALSKEEVRALYELNYKSNNCCLSYDKSGYKNGHKEVHWWKLNDGSGDPSDSAGSDDLTRDGATWTTGGKVWDNMLSWDGSNDYCYLSALPSDMADDTTGSFSFWTYYDDSDDNDWHRIFQASDSSGNEMFINWDYRNWAGNNNRLDVGFKNGGNWKWRLSVVNTLSSGSWDHWAVSYTGSYIKIWKNGVEQTITEDVTSDLTDQWFDDGSASWDNEMKVGDTNFDGKIQDFRYFSNHTFSQDDVDTLYNSGDGRTTSLSAPSPTLIHVNRPNITQGKYGLGVEYNGSDQYSFTENLDNFKNDTRGSISMWVKLDADPSSHQVLFSISNSAINNTSLLYLYFDDDPDKINIKLRIDSTNIWQYQYIPEASYADFVGIWKHLCIVQDGVSPTFYIDGVETSLNGVITTDPAQWMSDLIGDATTPADTLTIGAWANNNTHIQFFDGKVDEVRIYNRALNSNQVAKLYRNKLTNSVVKGTSVIFAGHDWQDEDIILRAATNADISSDIKLTWFSRMALFHEHEHGWSNTGGIVTETLPAIDFNVYVDETSADPEDDKTQTWENNATVFPTTGSYSAQQGTITLSDEVDFEPDTRYTIKVRNNEGTADNPTSFGFQANVQTTHFYDESEE